MTKQLRVVVTECALICLAVLCLHVVDAGRCTSITHCDSCPFVNDRPKAAVCDPFYAPDEINGFSQCTPCSINEGCLNCTTLSRCTLCKYRGRDGPDLNGVGTCSACAPNCRYCSVSGSGKCDICEPGTRQVGDQCEKCTVSNCYTCKNDKKTCDSCASGYLHNFLANKCEKCTDNCRVCETLSRCRFCNDKFFLNDGAQCEPCSDPNCIECNDFNHCTRCPYGFYVDEKTQTCLACDESCRACKSATECTYCKQGKVSAQGSCKCAPNCKSCIKAGNGKCDECEIGFSQGISKLCLKLKELSG